MTDEQLHLIRDLRRAAVASFMLREAKATLRLMQAKLERLVITDPAFPQDRDKRIQIGINPQTGRVWSLMTIREDRNFIRAEAAKRRARTADEVLTMELAKLDELEALAWSQGDGQLVLRCMMFREKLLGYGRGDTVNLNVEGRLSLREEKAKLRELSTQDVLRLYRERFTQPRPAGLLSNGRN